MVSFCASLSSVSARRATLSCGTNQPVSFMPSGSKMRSLKMRSSGIFATRSMRSPSTSVEIEYSNVVPGWCASGISPSRFSISSPVMSVSRASMLALSYISLRRGERTLPA
jgi:hypothetical protein